MLLLLLPSALELELLRNPLFLLYLACDKVYAGLAVCHVATVCRSYGIAMRRALVTNRHNISKVLDVSELRSGGLYKGL
jgi:hypothetical protein